MTTDEIVAGIDRSLAEIAAGSTRLLAARAELTGKPVDSSPAAAQVPSGGKPRRASGKRGHTLSRVLGGLDPTEARTARQVAEIAKVDRSLAASTLTRLVKAGQASKAKRGYLLAA